MIAGTALLAHPQRSTYNGYASCKGCHPGVDTGIMESLHWTWEMTDAFTGNPVGKINVINNYCVAVPSNEPRCTSCHIGIGWKDNTFDHTDGDQIDCLICHDGSGTYEKISTGGGDPVEGLDYNLITGSITADLTRNNCGICHFYGGGDDGVKHGSMDSSLADPSREVDVHMGGVADMSCTVCHSQGATHNIVGSRYSKGTLDNALCQNCHADPHADSENGGTLDFHGSKVACQTCHIPAYARGGKATKMFWDWTTAGTKEAQEFDADGNVIYDKKKGSFTWAKNVVPEYVWFNGNVTHVTLDDTFMEGEVVTINKLEGDKDDPNARIFPVKRFTGIQPYDAGTGKLAIPNLMPYPADTDTDAFWKAFDWELALTSGMEYVGRTFTGPVGNIATEMFWIQNHMVAPKAQALQCYDCHSTYGQLQFAALGYEEPRATQLQTAAQSMVWGGYPIMEGDFVDTGDWMGILYVGEKPWIYSFTLSKYIYIEESAVSMDGGWAYFLK
ncbi:MAG: tetrathionate reductase family octaheme c-type cytochrome [Oceanipulchritudo sp.]